MERTLRIISYFVAFSFLILLSGCSGKEEAHGGKIVAEINNYEMTTEDFKDEARLILPNKYDGSDPEVTKKQLLEEMITKQVLLQEAQRQNFDKDRAFMKEIERYWEQALLKLLIKKKMKELAKSIKIEDPDRRQEKMQEELNDWIADLRKKAEVKEYEANLKEVTLG